MLFMKGAGEALQKFPGQIFTGSEDMMRVLCLPMPSFAPRYLLQQGGWPLSRFIILVGQEESCKTSFAAEVVRWRSLLPGGGGAYIPTEPKESLELIYSIIGYENRNFRTHAYCKTTQKWNAAAKWWIKQFQTHMDGRKKSATQPAIEARGRTMPVALVVDSMMAPLDQNTDEKVEEKGASEKHYANNAQLLDDWFKNVCPRLRGYPITLLGINHMKPGQEKVGMFTRTVRNIGGGKTPKFLASIQIEMQRVTSQTPGKEINRPGSGEHGIEFRFLIYKNSLAPHEQINVDMLWYIDYEDRDPAGHFRQKTFFDWHSATTEILVNLTKGEGKQATRIYELLDVNADGDKRRVWSSALGMTAKSKVSYREFGQLLEEKLAIDEAFRNALYAECGIRRRYLFQPGQDFRQQEETAVALARQADNGWKQHARMMDLEDPPEPDVILESTSQDPPCPEEADDDEP